MSTLRELRKKAGMTLTELAVRVGTSPPQISRLEKGERKLTKEWADRLAPLLNCFPQDLLFGPSPGLSAPPQSPYSASDLSLEFPFDVPVYKAIFGIDGRFSSLSPEPVDYVRRLPRIVHARNVFALYAENASMTPRFEQGDIIYLNPAHPPKGGDYVLLELNEKADAAFDCGYIKRLISLTAHTALVEQFQPPGRIALDTTTIKSMIRIIPWNELTSL